MKFYAVRNGRTPGVYRTWEDAKKQVEGFSNAEYKAFDKITDASDYLDWNDEEKQAVLQKGEDNLEAAIKKIVNKTPSYHPEKETQISKKSQKTRNLHEFNLNEFDAKIYTDGGSRNTGASHKGGKVAKSDKAAWAYRIEYGQHEVHEAGGEFGATNNKMELTALINAFKRLIRLNLNDQKLIFGLDSKYVLDGINQGWIYGWAKRGWKKANGPLLNKEEWQEIYRFLPRFKQSEFAWVHGHHGNPGNEFVDHLLNKYMDEEM